MFSSKKRNTTISDILLTQYDIRQCRMIYLQCKYEITSVPSYAEGIYHPFQQERISLKKHLLSQVLFSGNIELNVYWGIGLCGGENRKILERQRFLCVQGPQNVFNPAFELNLYIELLQIAKLPMLTFQMEWKILSYTKKPCHSEEQQGHVQLFNWNCYFTNFNCYNFIQIGWEFPGIVVIADPVCQDIFATTSGTNFLTTVKHDP